MPDTTTRTPNRSLFELLAALLSIVRPVSLRRWTPEEILTEVTDDIKAINQLAA